MSFIRRVVRMHCMHAHRNVLPGIRYYNLRALLAPKPNDIVVTNELPDGSIADLKEHGLSAYMHYQLKRTDDCMFEAGKNDSKFLTMLRAEVPKCGKLIIQPYHMTPKVEELVDLVPGSILGASRYNLVQRYNDTGLSREAFIARNIRCLPGGSCSDERSIRNEVRRLRKLNIRMVCVKDPDPYLASGQGLLGKFRTDSSDSQLEYSLSAVLNLYKAYRGKKRVLVEEWREDASSSPSVTGHITPDGKIHLIATTTQILNGKSVYEGSIIPAQVSDDVLLQLMDTFIKTGNELADSGWVGVFCIDFIVFRDLYGKECTVPTELNARYSNSMYLSNVMWGLDLTHWFGYSLNLEIPQGTDYDSFRTAIEMIASSDRNQERVLPFNIGPLHLGKAAIIILINPAIIPKPLRRAEEICHRVKDVLDPLPMRFHQPYRVMSHVVAG